MNLEWLIIVSDNNAIDPAIRWERMRIPLLRQ
jgi:hypothetical protein